MSQTLINSQRTAVIKTASLSPPDLDVKVIVTRSKKKGAAKLKSVQMAEKAFAAKVLSIATIFQARFSTEYLSR